MVGLIIISLAIILSLGNIIAICYDIRNREIRSTGTLYFSEADSAMYLELDPIELPKRGYVTLKIRRV